MKGSVERELFYQCKVKARALIIHARPRWPLNPSDHGEIIAKLQRLTKAEQRIAETAYNAALADVVKDITNMNGDARGIRV